MENLKITGVSRKNDMPSVNFDAQTGVCVIEGQSFMAESNRYYHPVINWLKEYLSDKSRKIEFNFRVSYYNTSSSRYLLYILNLLREFSEAGGKAAINWYFDEGNPDIEEDIEDLMIDSGTSINMIPVK